MNVVSFKNLLIIKHQDVFFSKVVILNLSGSDNKNIQNFLSILKKNL